jgi:hypothetical protein
VASVVVAVGSGWPVLLRSWVVLAVFVALFMRLRLAPSLGLALR